MDLFIKILILLVITFLPFIELRLAIPVGILTGTIPLFFGLSIGGLGLHWLLVFVICVIANIVLGILVYNLLFFFDKHFRRSFFKKPYTKILDSAHKKVHKFTEKYGVLGVAFFIGLPIPGSGVYSGSIGAFVLGLEKKQFYKATVLGVLMAGTIVTILTVSGMALASLF